MSDETFYQHVDTLALLGLLVADDDDEARLRAYWSSRDETPCVNPAGRGGA